MSRNIIKQLQVLTNHKQTKWQIKLNQLKEAKLQLEKELSNCNQNIQLNNQAQDEFKLNTYKQQFSNQIIVKKDILQFKFKLQLFKQRIDELEVRQLEINKQILDVDNEIGKVQIILRGFLIKDKKYTELDQHLKSVV